MYFLSHFFLLIGNCGDKTDGGNSLTLMQWTPFFIKDTLMVVKESNFNSNKYLNLINDWEIHDYHNTAGGNNSY